MQGYENALEVKKAYNAAVTELEGVRKLQSEWDQKGIPEKKYWVIKANVPEQTRQKSIHERLEEKKRGMEQQKKKERKRNQDRDCLERNSRNRQCYSLKAPAVIAGWHK